MWIELKHLLRVSCGLVLFGRNFRGVFFYLPTFVAANAASCSNRETLLSLLEGYLLRSAPFVRECSRFWRFRLGLLLQLREHRLTFGACWSAFCSNLETLLSLLEGYLLRSAPFVRKCSRFWRV